MRRVLFALLACTEELVHCRSTVRVEDWVVAVGVGQPTRPPAVGYNQASRELSVAFHITLLGHHVAGQSERLARRVGRLGLPAGGGGGEVSRPGVTAVRVFVVIVILLCWLMMRAFYGVMQAMIGAKHANASIRHVQLLDAPSVQTVRVDDDFCEVAHLWGGVEHLHPAETAEGEDTQLVFLLEHRIKRERRVVREHLEVLGVDDQSGEVELAGAVVLHCLELFRSEDLELKALAVAAPPVQHLLLRLLVVSLGLVLSLVRSLVG